MPDSLQVWRSGHLAFKKTGQQVPGTAGLTTTLRTHVEAINILDNVLEQQAYIYLLFSFVIYTTVLCALLSLNVVSASINAIYGHVHDIVESVKCQGRGQGTASLSHDKRM